MDIPDGLVKIVQRATPPHPTPTPPPRGAVTWVQNRSGVGGDRTECIWMGLRRQVLAEDGRCRIRNNSHKGGRRTKLVMDGWKADWSEGRRMDRQWLFCQNG